MLGLGRMTGPRPNPLKNDPQRDATPTLRGYSYQILRTIEAWLDLPAGEILVIEGTEDLDRISLRSALVEQVKDTAGSGSVTLRNKGALDAIANLHEHQIRNPGVTIHFRYLTTSTIGREQGDPMKLGRPALTVWDAVRQRPRSKATKADAEAIRLFLAASPGLSKEARTWITSLTTAAFIRRVVEPLEWVSGQGDIKALRGRLEARLIELGEKKQLSAADSIRALDALHRHVWTIATDVARQPLRRGDLLRIVEQSGRTSIPTEQLIGLLATLKGEAHAETSIIADAVIEAPPRRPLRHLERTNTVTQIGALLETGALVIHGGTGMGKTYLAADAVRDAASIAWINLRDADVGVAAARIRAISPVASLTDGMTVVLDDLDPGDDPRRLETALSGLNSALSARSGSLIVTSAQPLPPRLAAALGMDAHHQLQAPPLEEHEIERYLLEQSCPATLSVAWSKLIRATTGGHPQLVSARIASLQTSGFPPPSYEDVIRPSEDALNIRAEARRLISSLPPGQREMLCRVSLMSGRLPRSRLLRVAALDQAVDSPGDVLDRLAGPWLEMTASTDLRASPLLRDLGLESYGKSWVTGMHAGIAAVYVSDHSLDASDVSSIMLHCVLGETARPLVRLLPSLLQASAQVWHQVGETAGVFAHIGVEASANAPFSDPVDLAIFRILQFRIAAERDEAGARKVLDRAIGESDGAGEEMDFFVLLLLWQAIQNEELKFDPVTRVRLALRFAEVAERIRAALPARMIAGGVNPEANDWPAASTLAAFGTLAAIRDTDGLDAVLSELDGLARSDAHLLLEGLGSIRSFGGIALMSAWIAETRRPSPRWPFLAATLERLVHTAHAHGVDTLAASAAALLVRVMDEDMENAHAAEKAADRLLGILGADPRLLAAKAKILWRSGREVEGLAIYDTVLPQFQEKDLELVDTARDAGVAAARMQDWDRSAAFFRRALAADASLQAPARIMGLWGDLALCLQLAKRTEAAVEAFTSAAEPMYDVMVEPVEPVLSTWHRINEAAKMILADHMGVTPLDPASMSKVVGMCSSLEPFNWSETIPAPLDVVLFNVLALDAVINPLPAAAFIIEDRIRRSPNLIVNIVSGAHLFELAVLRSDFSNVVADAVVQVKAIAASRSKTVGDPFRTFDPSSALTPSSEDLLFVRARIIGALFALVSRNEADCAPYQAWREALPPGQASTSTLGLIDWAERMLKVEVAPWKCVFPAPSTWEEQVVASLAAVARQRLSPDQLLYCHALWGSYLRRPLISGMTDVSAATIVTQQWLDACDSPAELVTPRLNVPAIRAAATGGTMGWDKVFAVITAASYTVSAECRKFVAKALQQMRE